MSGDRLLARVWLPHRIFEEEQVKHLTVVGVFALVTLTGAFASAEAGVIGARQHRQAVRIHAGVRSGQLTRHERRLLVAGQRRIQVLKRWAWRDGALTRAERRRIAVAQNRQSRLIARFRHNRFERVL